MAYFANEFNIVGANSALVMEQLRHCQTTLRTERTEELKTHFLGRTRAVGERIMALMPGTTCDFRHHVTDGIKVFEVEIGVSRWEESPHGFLIAFRDVTGERSELLDLQSTASDPVGKAALVLMEERRLHSSGGIAGSHTTGDHVPPPSFDHNGEISKIDFKEIVIDGRRDHGALTILLRNSGPDGSSTSHSVYAVPGQTGASFNTTTDRNREITNQVGPHAVTIKDMEVACGCAKFMLPWVETFIEQGLIRGLARVVTP